MIIAKWVKVYATLIVSVFVLMLTTGHKRFVVWPQITDHYVGMIHSASPVTLCTVLKEQELRLQSKILKVESLDQHEIYKNCVNSVASTNGSYVPPERSIAPQVNNNSFYRQLTTVSHKVRTSIFLPIVALSLALQINLHLLFSIVCCICLLVTCCILSRIFIKENFELAFCLFLCFFFSLSLFMNGRMIISFLSIALLIWATREKLSSTQFIFVMLTSFILSNMSSGVNVIVFALFLWYIFTDLRFKNLSKAMWIWITLISTFQFMWVFFGIAKNAMYYHGNPWALPVRILSHGAGKFLFQPAYAPLTILVVLGVVYIVYSNRKRWHNILWSGLGLFVIGGLFGLSVLSGSLVFLATLIVGCFVPYRSKN